MLAPGGMYAFLASTMLLGVGTALVYPTLIAVVSDASEPAWRARALGVYRFWRDMGYAVGALLAGSLADRFGFSCSIAAIGTLTLASGIVMIVSRRKKKLDS